MTERKGDLGEEDNGEEKGRLISCEALFGV